VGSCRRVPIKSVVAEKRGFPDRCLHPWHLSARRELHYSCQSHFHPFNMLSRAILRAGAHGRVLTLTARPVSTTKALKAEAQNPTAADVDIFENEKNPLRDHVNFPRRKYEEFGGKVRHHWIPEEYFQYFYPKTGVTGPYMFLVSLGTYLTSKEIWVLEHEFYCGIAFFGVLSVIIQKVGPGVKAELDSQFDKHTAVLSSMRQKEIDRCKAAIEDESSAQFMAGSYEELIAAKKENVALQLESEYRARLKDAFTQVKRRLDFQLQTANVIRTNEQRHMVDWILSNVKKSITAKQEEDALKKCVADLKGLAKA